MNTSFDFVPPGHKAIMGVPVIAAWSHPSGAWLSLQRIGPAIALVWRASDAWAATSMVVEEVCDSLDYERNLKTARVLADYIINEQGPPKELLQSAERSREVRSKRGSKAANARWSRQRIGSGLVLPPAVDYSKKLEMGPKHNKDQWEWRASPENDPPRLLQYELIHKTEYVGFYVYIDRYGGCDLRCVPEYGGEIEDVLQQQTLQRCYEVMEAAIARPISKWRRGDMG